jgi:hypothetical protein
LAVPETQQMILLSFMQQVADDESLAAPGVIQDDISNPTGSPPQPQTKKVKPQTSRKQKQEATKKII